MGTHPADSTRLDHPQARSTFLVHATDDRRHTEGPDAGVESVRLSVLSHPVRETRHGDRIVVLFPPLESFVASTGGEVTGVGDQPGARLENTEIG